MDAPNTIKVLVFRAQVVAELAEPFVPLPDDLLVNLAESRGVVEALLDSLPSTFAVNSSVRLAGVFSRFRVSS